MIRSHEAATRNRWRWAAPLLLALALLGTTAVGAPAARPPGGRAQAPGAGVGA